MCYISNNIKNNESLVNITNIFYLCCTEEWNRGNKGNKENNLRLSLPINHLTN